MQKHPTEQKDLSRASASIPQALLIQDITGGAWAVLGGGEREVEGWLLLHLLDLPLAALFYYFPNTDFCLVISL